jgi:hypothetical protein
MLPCVTTARESAVTRQPTTAGLERQRGGRSCEGSARAICTESPLSRLRRYARLAALTAGAVLMVLPLVYMISVSFKLNVLSFE